MMLVYMLMTWGCSAATGDMICHWEPQAAAYKTLAACLGSKDAPPANWRCEPVLVRSDDR